MTNEEIKQRAEIYASENYHPYGSETNPQYLTVSEDSFIAGAHSRDEEIEKWKNLCDRLTIEKWQLQEKLYNLDN